MLHTLVEEPKAGILVLVGLLRLSADEKREIDLTSCDSLENGVILLTIMLFKVNSELICC